MRKHQFVNDLLTKYNYHLHNCQHAITKKLLSISETARPPDPNYSKNIAEINNSLKSLEKDVDEVLFKITILKKVLTIPQSNIVQHGTFVLLKCVSEQKEHLIIDAFEDEKAGIVGINSPLGQKLAGKSVGDSVEVLRVPATVVEIH